MSVFCHVEQSSINGKTGTMMMIIMASFHDNLNIYDDLWCRSDLLWEPMEFDDDDEKNSYDNDDNLYYRKLFLTWTASMRTVGAGVPKASKINGIRRSKNVRLASFSFLR